VRFAFAQTETVLGGVQLVHDIVVRAPSPPPDCPTRQPPVAGGGGGAAASLLCPAYQVATTRNKTSKKVVL
jgi:hypothetical protein